MDTILRVLDVLVGLALIGVVLLQRSEGGGLGMGSSSNAFMSVRGTANFLTRVTGILAGIFMITSLALALLANPREAQRSIFDVPGSTPAAPAPASAPAPSGQIPVAPAPPATPTTQPAPAQNAPQPGAPAPRGP
jgi:preprotein translocase subunit SecG